MNPDLRTNIDECILSEMHKLLQHTARANGWADADVEERRAGMSDELQEVAAKLPVAVLAPKTYHRRA